MMKPFHWKRVLVVVLGACLAAALFTSVVPASSARAAATHRTRASIATCAPGFEEIVANKRWYPGDYDTERTCSGKLIKLIYQTDGNFVLYINGVPKWASGTSFIWSCEADYADFQTDGNLVVYDSCIAVWGAQAEWDSGTEGKGATNLDLQGDGNLVIYKNWSTSPSNALWASNTCCYS